MRSTLGMNQKTADKIRGLSACPDNVLYNPGVPILITDLDMGFKRWVPPKSGKFVELGPEDEHWARPLGIGTLEDVEFIAFNVSDEYMREANLRIQERITRLMHIPESILCGDQGSTLSGSYSAMKLLMERIGFAL